jgi:hypothetical protein
MHPRLQRNTTAWLAPNTSRMDLGVVLSRCSCKTCPASANTQYQLERSPRSNPMVSFGREKFLLAFLAAVLPFFIAALLYLLRFERVDNLGAYRIPSETGLLISSGFVSYDRSEFFRMRVALLFPFLALMAVSAATQVRDGTIRGTVLNDEGTPVADAHVSAEVMQGEKIITVLSTETDTVGTFLFPHVTLGEYRVSAEKSEDGYLSTRPDIFECRPPLTVVLTQESPANTSIRFLPKAGTITGWVKDSATGRPIAAHLSLEPITACGWSTTGTADRYNFRLKVPADTPVRLGACAEGYKPWFYADRSNPSHPAPLELRPNTEFEIDIKLEPSEGSGRQPCVSGKY